MDVDTRIYGSFEELPKEGVKGRIYKVNANPWFRWFAWYPVWTYDRGWRWMRMVWRRHVPPKLGVPGSNWYFEHRVKGVQ